MLLQKKLHIYVAIIFSQNLGKQLYVIWYYNVESMYITFIIIGTMLMYSFCYFYFMCNILQSCMLISTDLQLFLFFITISIEDSFWWSTILKVHNICNEDKTYVQINIYFVVPCDLFYYILQHPCRYSHHFCLDQIYFVYPMESLT